jgi:hypothetical protein
VNTKKQVPIYFKMVIRKDFREVKDDELVYLASFHARHRWPSRPMKGPGAFKFVDSFRNWSSEGNYTKLLCHTIPSDCYFRIPCMRQSKSQVIGPWKRVTQLSRKHSFVSDSSIFFSRVWKGSSGFGLPCSWQWSWPIPRLKEPVA